MTDHGHDHDHEQDIFDRGLQFDLSTNARRRGVLGLIAGVGLATVAGCTTNPAPQTSSAAQSDGEIPEETAGPFPGDGSNGPDVLTQSGIVRRDIRTSFGSASGVAAGVPLTIELTVLDLAANSAPLRGGAVYVWHCDREGRYSLYSDGVTNENYLRGVQETGTDGTASFTSVFPACYSGRWPHIHFEVYRNLAAATSAGNKLATSQIALPQAACEAVYATDGYGQSVRNLSRVSLATDMVFRDGWTSELGTVTGTAATGLTVSLTARVR